LVQGRWHNDVRVVLNYLNELLAEATANLELRTR
jgi:hypothetical protein